MSARQLRRLRDLVKASTGADADDDVEDCPSTMKVSRDAKKSRRQRKAAVGQEAQEQHKEEGYEQLLTTTNPTEVVIERLSGGERDNDDDDDDDGNGLHPVAPRGTEEILAAANNKKRKKKQKKQARRQCAGDDKDGEDEGDSTGGCNHQHQEEEEKGEAEGSQKDNRIDEGRGRKQRTRKRKDTRRKKEREEEEEELLLEAVLRQRELEVGSGGGGAARWDVARDMGGETDLLVLLSTCNPQMLDSRQERIRRFGVSAVEDVGDSKVPQRRADNRPSSLLFADHWNHVPRFRHSVLATPNRYCWPPYDGLGAFLAVKETGGSGGPLVYCLDNSASEMRRANVALAMCEAHHGGVEGLIACLSTAPYHIPTLILASNLFETMGSVPRAQEAIDVALYHVGVLFSRFPLRQTVRRRSLPFAFPANRQLFQILRCGVHQALRKAATRTAWEIAKLLYSLDATDPMGMLLMLDYLALRSKRWAWLVHVYFVMVSELERDAIVSTTSADGDDGDDVDDVDRAFSNRKMALALSTLPGFFFSAALAKCFLEREGAAHVDKAGERRKVSKVVHEMSPEQVRAFHSTPPAAVILANAIGRFPTSAVLLVDKVGDCTSASAKIPEAWKEIVMVHEAATDEDALHVATLWVARNAEMWKATEPRAFLRRVVMEQDGVCLPCHSHSAATATVATPRRVSSLAPWRHGSLKEEDLMGNTLTAIPAHLLDPNEFTEEDMHDAERRTALQGLSAMDRDALLRFQALYGPLSPSMLSPAEQLARYEERFEADERERNVRREYSPLFLFFQTFLSWGSTRDVALQNALNDAGIPDPVAARSEQLQVEYEDDDDDDNDDDDDEWMTEESWEGDECLHDTISSEEEDEGE